MGSGGAEAEEMVVPRRDQHKNVFRVLSFRLCLSVSEARQALLFYAKSSRVVYYPCSSPPLEA